jgi:hypothetical protein
MTGKNNKELSNSIQLEPQDEHDRNIILSLFNNVKAVIPETTQTTWINFANFILDGHEIFDSDKNEGAHFNCVEYNGYRDTDHAIAMTALTLDYDELVSLDEAKEMFKQYEYILYTSYNHQAFKYHEDGTIKDTPKDKFRIILPFDKPCPVNEWLMIKEHVSKFSPNVDNTSKNITQLFCRNLVHSDNKTKAETHYNHGEFLDWTTWPKEEPTQRVINGQLPPDWKPSSYEGNFDEDQVFQLKHGTIRAGDITGKVSHVYCPWHADKSPGSFLNKTGSTVYHHCHKCRTHKMVKATINTIKQGNLLAQHIKQLKQASETLEDKQNLLYEMDDEIIYKDRWVKPIPNIDNSVYFVKSHKDSGKTTQLKEFISDTRKQGKRILVIGHRVTLLKEMAHELNLSFYKDVTWKNDQELKCLALCVNSMGRLENILKHYDLIIIDESEQVIDHFVGKTIKPEFRGNVAKETYKSIKSAKQIVCLDADLSSEKTVNFIMDIKPEGYYVNGSVNTWKMVNHHINIWNNKVNIENHLEACIKKNESIFLVSNSKTFIDHWYSFIKELGHSDRTFKITADSSDSDEVRDYLRALKDDATGSNRILLASPSLGTGVNIQAEFDNIIGIFESGVNSHFDMDQQLRRVRNAKNIDVWITGKTLKLETNSHIIKKALLDNDQETRRLIDYSLSDSKEKWFDHLLNTYSHTEANKNKSMNQLRSNFINLKKEQGYTVNIIGKIENDKPVLDLKKLSTKERKQLKTTLSSAKSIDKNDYDGIATLRRRTEEQTQSIMRYKLEKEFGVSILDQPAIVDWWFDRKKDLANWQLFCTPDETLKDMDSQSMQNHLIDRPHLVQRQKYIKQGLTALELLQDNGGINVDHILLKGEPNIDKFISWAKANGDKIKNILGIEVRGKRATNSPIELVKNFIAQAGLKTITSGKILTANRNYLSIYQVDKAYLQWLTDTVKLKEGSS